MHFPQPHSGKKSFRRNVFRHNEYLFCWAIVTSLVQLIQPAKKVINNGAFGGKTEVLSAFQIVDRNRIHSCWDFEPGDNLILNLL